jgi:PleD family two-component response regulator
MTNLSVLVAITDLFFLSKIRTALESQGCTIRVATKSEQILKEALAQKPSLIVLDLGLPALDPVRLVEELRGNPELHTLPVLGYTNHTQVPYWEEKLNDKTTKVVPNSYISSNITNIVGILNNFRS